LFNSPLGQGSGAISERTSEMSTDKQAARAKKKKSPTASDRKIDKKNMLMVKTQRELDNID